MRPAWPWAGFSVNLKVYSSLWRLYILLDFRQRQVYLVTLLQSGPFQSEGCLLIIIAGTFFYHLFRQWTLLIDMVESILTPVQQVLRWSMSARISNKRFPSYSNLHTFSSLAYPMNHPLGICYKKIILRILRHSFCFILKFMLDKQYNREQYVGVTLWPPRLCIVCNAKYGSATTTRLG